jgi:hypothetical protein
MVLGGGPKATPKARKLSERLALKEGLRYISLSCNTRLLYRHVSLTYNGIHGVGSHLDGLRFSMKSCLSTSRRTPES